MNIKPIKKLPDAIAKKIAAGEVVERPASIVKELLENSLDAGSTAIEVTIINGGLQQIAIQDNGSGIPKEDLPLATVQHATSKIETFEDLLAVCSLGFRGEALASIASVSEMRIVSCVSDEASAWALNQDQVQQAAHPIGTTITVSNLFYNVPARKKFLKSERTEFQYIDEVFRRIALSHFNVRFTLLNGSKVVRNLPACTTEAAQFKRLSQICGKQVLSNALKIDATHNGMRLWGWIADPTSARSQEIHQYFYINNRVIKDRVINHALRQAYQAHCPEGKSIFYCLFLEVDPVALDVNVHPTKHEVRFQEARVIHAFLSQTISQALAEPLEESLKQPLEDCQKSAYERVDDEVLSYPKTNLEKIPPVQQQYPEVVKPKILSQSLPKPKIIPVEAHPFGRVLTQLDQRILITESPDGICFINIQKAYQQQLLQQLMTQWQQNMGLTSQLLMMPEMLFNPDWISEVDDFSKKLHPLGFDIQQVSPEQVLVRGLPKLLHGPINELKIRAVCDALYQQLDDNILNDLEKRQEILNCIVGFCTISFNNMEHIHAILQTLSLQSESVGKPWKTLSADNIFEKVLKINHLG